MVTPGITVEYDASTSLIIRGGAFKVTSNGTAPVLSITGYEIRRATLLAILASSEIAIRGMFQIEEIPALEKQLERFLEKVRKCK